MTITDLAELDLAGIDLTDPRTHLERDLAPVWREYRRRAPVFRHPAAEGRAGFWVVSRHRDQSTVYRDHRRFGIERGNMLSTLLGGGDSAGGRMVSVADGPRHRDLRGVILRAFSPRALEFFAQRVRDYTHGLLDDYAAAGGGDFAAEVAAKVPITTICDLLGVPESDRAQLLELNTRAMSSDDPSHTELDARMARSEIIMYFTDLVRARTKDPGDDVVSLLASTEIDGRLLPAHDVVLNCYGLLVAGEETSRYSMTSAVHALATWPGEWQRLRSGAVDVGAATDEMIRWATPVMHVGRTVLEDAEIAGTPVAEGDIVTLWTSSANRDEEVFEDPDRLDLGRTPNRHLAFGFGPHYCLGVFLARAEIGAVLEGLRDRVTTVDLDGPVQRVFSNVLNGYSRLPITLTPA
ncbi:MAG TPA: cytochrome P450 [Pseudonocardiaceae bacterium]